MEELTVAERIDHYMGKYHLKAADVARRIGISERSFIRYKKEPDLFRYGQLKMLCGLFHCEIEHLLEGR